MVEASAIQSTESGLPRGSVRLQAAELKASRSGSLMEFWSMWRSRLSRATASVTRKGSRWRTVEASAIRSMVSESPRGSVRLRAA